MLLSSPSFYFSDLIYFASLVCEELQRVLLHLNSICGPTCKAGYFDIVLWSWIGQ